MYAPIVDRESTDTIMPWSNLNARVVVPLANFTVWFESAAPHADAKLLRQKCAGCRIGSRERRVIHQLLVISVFHTMTATQIEI